MVTHIQNTSVDLAKCIYYAREAAYHLEGLHWDALEPAVKAIYVAQAQDVLHANRPQSEPEVMQSFAPRPAKVVGTISPSTRSGVFSDDTRK